LAQTGVNESPVGRKKQKKEKLNQGETEKTGGGEQGKGGKKKGEGNGKKTNKRGDVPSIKTIFPRASRGQQGRSSFMWSGARRPPPQHVQAPKTPGVVASWGL